MSLLVKFNNYILKAVGKKPSSQEIVSINKQIDRFYEQLDNKKFYRKVAPLWKKVVANETNPKEIIFISRNVDLSKKDNIASFASGLGVLESFMAREFVTKGHVYCIDFSTQMNKEGEIIAKNMNVNNISFITASAIKVTLKDNSQKLILARRSGLSIKKEWKKVLQEIRRIIKNESNSRFIYTVQSNLCKPKSKILLELNRHNLELVKIQKFKDGSGEFISMIIVKPSVILL